VVLRKSVEINNISNVTVLPIALGRFAGLMVLYSGVMPSASTFYPSKERVLHKVRFKRNVRVIPMDTLLIELGFKKVDWIKIDVEGADLDVLQGAELFLKGSENVKIMVRVSCNKTLEYLRRNGFELKQLGARYFFATKPINWRP
jgi:FkbM family methyltransferase